MDSRKRTRPRHTRILPGLLLLAAAMTTAAHHGWSGYDSSKTMTLSGKIRASGYEHPHGYVSLQTRDKNWNVVLAPPYRMENRGLTREMLKPGTPATVQGYPHREDADELRAERITINDTTVELR